MKFNTNKEEAFVTGCKDLNHPIELKKSTGLEQFKKSIRGIIDKPPHKVTILIVDNDYVNREILTTEIVKQYSWGTSYGTRWCVEYIDTQHTTRLLSIKDNNLSIEEQSELVTSLVKDNPEYNLIIITNSPWLVFNSPKDSMCYKLHIETSYKYETSLLGFTFKIIESEGFDYVTVDQLIKSPLFTGDDTENNDNSGYGLC